MLEAEAVRGIDVEVKRQSGMVPDTLKVNAGPMGKYRPAFWTERMVKRAIRFANIRPCQEAGFGCISRGDVVVVEPPAIVQVGVADTLHIRLSAFPWRPYCSGLRCDRLPSQCPAFFQSYAIIETAIAIERSQVFPIGVDNSRIGLCPDISIHAPNIN